MKIRPEESKRLATKVIMLLHKTSLVEIAYQINLSTLRRWKELKGEIVTEEFWNLNAVPMIIRKKESLNMAKDRTLYVISAGKVTRKQLKIGKAYDISFWSNKPTSQLEKEKRKNFAICPLRTRYCREKFQSRKSEAMQCAEYAATGNENVTEDDTFLVRMIQLCSDKTTTMLKANATLAYPVHIKLSNFTTEYRLFQ